MHAADLIKLFGAEMKNVWIETNNITTRSD